jgi:hypothetical protein
MMDFLKDYGTLGPLGFPMADRQARQLDTLLRALPRQKEYEYRRLVSARAPTELNPGERSDVSWISTESLDRMGEVVIARGMNNSQFVQNPLVTLGHAYWMPPVGKSLWQKRVRDGDLVGIKAKTRYPQRPADWPADDPWPPDKVFSLVQAGLLNGKSIGFLPTKVHFADAKEAKKENWPEGTLVIDEWLLLEYACCFLPANQDALVESVSKGQAEVTPDLARALGLEGIDLHQPAAQSVIPFTPLAEVEKAVAGALAGVDLEEVVRKATEQAWDRARGRV